MALDSNSARRTTRRALLKGAALAGAAASALGLLGKRPFRGSRTGDKSVPAGLPGAGSIFQPRGDARRQ